MIIDIERIIREETRKLLLGKMHLDISMGSTTKNKPQLHANMNTDGVIESAQKATKTSILLGLWPGEAYTFVCPKKTNLQTHRTRALALVQYVKKQYGVRYTTHRVDNGIEIVRLV